MKKLSLILISIVLTSCGALLEPLFNGISSGFIQHARQDTCKKVLTAKIIDYRIKNDSFPKYLSDLDLNNVNETELDIAMDLMLLPDSTLTPSTLQNFNRSWRCNCSKQLDSVSFTPYQIDSIDVFTSIIQHGLDTTYCKMKNNRRLIFDNDTLSKIKLLKFEFMLFNKDGEEITYQRLGKMKTHR